MQLQSLKIHRFYKQIFMFACVIGVQMPIDGYSDILPPEYIFDYMLKGRGNFAGLEVKQGVLFYNKSFPEGKVSGEETVHLKWPSKFRVNGQYQEVNQIWVNEGNRSVVVTNGRMTEEGFFRHSLLRALFVSSNGNAFLEHLARVGVTTQTTSLGRNGDQLVYIIGAKDGDLNRPQIWVEKEFFQPVKIIVFETLDGESGKLEINFSSFGKNGPSWFPGRTEIKFKDELIVEMWTERAKSLQEVPDNLFDVVALQKKYPADSKKLKKIEVSSTRMGETFSAIKQAM